jgi:predicted TIM-barrel fold metal-dependent hydrolase
MMYKIIDFHTHAFPDLLADRAIKTLEKAAGVKACLSGTISALLQSMDRCGIDKSVVCSIATKPSQFESIITWSAEARSERIIPLPSVHPEDPKASERVYQIKAEGFKGIKLHPYYQEFFIDEERLFPLYDAVCKHNLMLVMHTGFDIAFPPIRRADPEKIMRVLDQFPSMRLITTHFGSWKLWEEVEKSIIGRKVYMELSFALEFLREDEVRSMIMAHPREYILFGSDSPWTSQEDSVSLVRRLDLGGEMERLIFRDNALSLLNAN